MRQHTKEVIKYLSGAGCLVLTTAALSVAIYGAIAYVVVWAARAAW
jgi:hypothetical protein